MSVRRFDRPGTFGRATLDEATGFLRAPATPTRAGVFAYRDGKGGIRRELRSPEEVGDAISLASMRGVPVTDGHPSAGIVTAKNARQLTRGHVVDQVTFESDLHVHTGFVVQDEALIADMQSGAKAQVSMGYTCDLVHAPGTWAGPNGPEDYDAIQTRIRYNHAAGLPRGRAGESARVHLDADDAAEVESETEPHAEPAKAPDRRVFIFAGDTRQDQSMLTKEIGKGSAALTLGSTHFVGVDADFAAEVQKRIDELRADADGAKLLAETETKRADDAEALAVTPEAMAAEVATKIGVIAKARAAGFKCDETDAELAALDAHALRVRVLAEVIKADLSSDSIDYVRARFDMLPEAAPEAAKAEDKAAPKTDAAASAAAAGASPDAIRRAQLQAEISAHFTAAN